MREIDEALLPDERILFEAKGSSRAAWETPRNWVTALGVIALGVMSIVARPWEDPARTFAEHPSLIVYAGLVALDVVVQTFRHVRRRNCRMAVTDRRVLVCSGFLGRTLEIGRLTGEEFVRMRGASPRLVGSTLGPTELPRLDESQLAELERVLTELAATRAAGSARPEAG